ncbi:hypothetical protein AOQ84DRAFT_412119 [Glonium stellatum]|uniref:Uncharacterized protein n=1 Tax=Glonium stellatum TaxID=574774 RepID=A0A8E2FB68_9PEZI|nr:hypothetical protein AOQ84DRAFT_412119 [Glonium stellatum]
MCFYPQLCILPITETHRHAYLRIVLPLYLVALHSPSTAQRQVATSFFETWRKSGTMVGMRTLALQRIDEFQSQQRKPLLAASLFYTEKSVPCTYSNQTIRRRKQDAIVRPSRFGITGS